MRINSPIWVWLSFYLALSANLWLVHYNLREQLLSIADKQDILESELVDMSMRIRR